MSTAVATATATPVPQPPSDTTAILHMVERASRDPSVDVDKMLRLFEMRDRYKAEAAREAFDAAMTAAQSEMRPVAKDASNPQTRSKFATHYGLDKALRPHYTKHGFNLSYDTEQTSDPNTIIVICRVACSGHSRTHRIPMPCDGKGAKGNDVMTRTHATGSAVTYGKRYLLKMIFNIVEGGDPSDDDGNTAGHVPDVEQPYYISDEQVATLKKKLAERGKPEDLFLKKFRLANWGEAPTAKFDEYVRFLNTYPLVAK